MTDREEQITRAFSALDAGDLQPFRELFDPDARWIGVPVGGEDGETPACPDRATIVERLQNHHRNGRRFSTGKLISEGDRVAVELEIAAPEWSGPVRMFKVFTFRPGSEVVVRLNDCIDESYALQVLAA
jgi:ketosteroid isomerase-like protein